MISDGGDNSSRYTESEILNLVRESDVQVYAVGLLDRGSRFVGGAVLNPASNVLDGITLESGGRLVAAESARDLANAAERIGLEMRNQYVIGYSPADPRRDARYRRVSDKVTPAHGAPPLSAVWRRGYYAK